MEEIQIQMRAQRLREELETAWLYGFEAGRRGDEIHAANYAERVVGGSTRPERPEVER
jgi:hypothetical protein